MDAPFTPRPFFFARVWKAVFQHQHKPTLRTLGLSMVSHNTLLRAPGPLGVYAITPRDAEKRQIARQYNLQRGILMSALELGIVSAKEVEGFL